MHVFNLLGDRDVATTISCIVFLLCLYAGYALAVLWCRHYFCRSAGGIIAARLIGILLAVPAGNGAARIFTGYYTNFDERGQSALLLGFIALCVAASLALLADAPKNRPIPPQQSPPAGGPYGNP